MLSVSKPHASETDVLLTVYLLHVRIAMITRFYAMSQVHRHADLEKEAAKPAYTRQIREEKRAARVARCESTGKSPVNKKRAPRTTTGGPLVTVEVTSNDDADHNDIDMRDHDDGARDGEGEQIGDEYSDGCAEERREVVSSSTDGASEKKAVAPAITKPPKQRTPARRDIDHSENDGDRELTGDDESGGSLAKVLPSVKYAMKRAEERAAALARQRAGAGETTPLASASAPQGDGANASKKKKDIAPAVVTKPAHKRARASDGKSLVQSSSRNGDAAGDGNDNNNRVDDTKQEIAASGGPGNVHHSNTKNGKKRTIQSEGSAGSSTEDDLHSYAPGQPRDAPPKKKRKATNTKTKKKYDDDEYHDSDDASEALAQSIKTKKKVFAALVFVITGKLERYSHASMQELIEEHGGRVLRTATRAVTHVVATDGSKKMKTAKTAIGFGAHRVCIKWIEECIKVGKLVAAY